MTQLLVSVRSAAEAVAALAGGAEFIDVKEPRRGPLGFADALALREIRSVVGDRAILSAALGEIVHTMPREDCAALASYSFAKLGLAGAAANDQWPRAWRDILRELPGNVQPVAVAYADWRTCDAPAPSEMLAQLPALERPCRALLVDTFAKQGSTIFDFISHRQLADLLSSAGALGLCTLVAGSLDSRQLPQVLALSPDVVAVRGAVCDGGREGTVDAQKVAEFRAEMARHSHHRRGHVRFSENHEFA